MGRLLHWVSLFSCESTVLSVRAICSSDGQPLLSLFSDPSAVDASLKDNPTTDGAVT